ncbi:MAG: DUF2282 domain-containing protein [Rhodanobacter sp.]
MNPNKVTKAAITGVIALGMTWLVTGTAIAGTSPAATIKPDPKPPVMTAAIILNRTKIYTDGWVKCYGINAADKNTCHTATVNCGTNAPKNGPDAFVAVPNGLCTRIAGGSLTPKITVKAAKEDGMPLSSSAG